MTQATDAPLSQDDVAIIEFSRIASRCAGRLLLEHDAEDLAQDVVLEFIESVRGGKQVNLPELPGLVRSMVLFRFFDVYKANRRREKRDGEFAIEYEVWSHAWMYPASDLNDAEVEALVRRTLTTLSPMCRTTYLMVRDDEQPYKVVAQTLGISRAAVCGHVVEAQRRLREALADWLVQPSGKLSIEHAAPDDDSGQVLLQRALVAA